MKSARPGAWSMVMIAVALAFAAGGCVALEAWKMRAAARELASWRAEATQLKEAIAAAQKNKVVGEQAVTRVSPEETMNRGLVQVADVAPDIATLRARAALAEVARRYRRFFREGGNAETVGMRAMERMAATDLRMAEISQSLSKEAARDSTQVAALRAKLKDEQARLREELGALLGPEGVKQLERFQEREPHWKRASDLAAYLHDTDTPLTPWQVEQVAQTMIAAATDASGRVAPSVTDWSVVIAHAKTFLSPPQLEVLQTGRDYEQAWREVNRMRGLAMRKKSAQ